MKAVHLHYTEALIKRAVRAFWWRKTGAAYFGSLALGAALLGFLISNGQHAGLTALITVTLVFGVVVAGAVFLVHLRSSLTRFRRLRTPSATFEPGDERFRLSSDVGSGELAWSTVTALWRFPDFWLLFYSAAQFNILPTAELDAETREFVIARVRAHGGKVF